MRAEDAAEAVAGLMAERGWTLGLIECATGGAVARLLFNTEEGPAILSDSVNVATVEDAIDLLGLPEQQFKTMGGFSPKAARAAAREGRDFLDVAWCLVVWAEPLPAAGGTVRETIYLTLNTGDEILEEVLLFEGAAAQMQDWLSKQAMAFVWTGLGQSQQGAVS